MDIKYKVKFHSEWHCGAGLSAGADADMLVIKDNNGLPYIPGKTIKGLLREAVEDVISFSSLEDSFADDIIKIFGMQSSADVNNTVAEKGLVFFSNVELSDFEKKAITANSASSYLYRTISRTAIGPDGVALPHSLRKIQVVAPCELEGYILNVPDNNVELIKKAMQYIKRLGQDRNRGLGRCTFMVK